jgi:carbonic anhydrase
MPRFSANLIPFLVLFIATPLLAEMCDHGHGASFAFDYAQQGKDWPQLCSLGKKQSPINIDTKQSTCDSGLRFDLIFTQGLRTFTTETNGYSLSVHDEVSSLVATDVEGHLFQSTAHEFHFHSPSEHTINHQHFDLELHIVHTADTQAGPKHLSVIGILFKVNDNAGPHPFIDALDAQNTGKAVKVDIQSLLGSKVNSKLNYFSYEGSLTTPPCTEGVTWYVVEAPQTITSAQLKIMTQAKLGNLRGGSGNKNSRIVQHLNGRKVRKGGAVCKPNIIQNPKNLKAIKNMIKKVKKMKK